MNTLFELFFFVVFVFVFVWAAAIMSWVVGRGRPVPLPPRQTPGPQSEDILIVKVTPPVGREYYEARGPRLPPRRFATPAEAEAWAMSLTKPTRTVVKRIKRTT